MRVSAWPYAFRCKARFAANIENIGKKRNAVSGTRKASPCGAYRRAYLFRGSLARDGRFRVARSNISRYLRRRFHTDRIRRQDRRHIVVSMDEIDRQQRGRHDKNNNERHQCNVPPEPGNK